MDWYLHDRDLRHERVNKSVNLISFLLKQLICFVFLEKFEGFFVMRNAVMNPHKNKKVLAQYLTLWQLKKVKTS